MKVLKKLTDWKTWIFFIFPVLMFVIWLVIFIYAVAESVYTIPLIICAQILFIIGVLLMDCPVIYRKLKQKFLLRGIAAIVLVCCFVCLQAVTMVFFPKLCKVSAESERLYEEYKQTSYDDESFDVKQKLWREALKERSDLSFTIQFMFTGSCIFLCLASICAGNARTENVKTDESC